MADLFGRINVEIGPDGKVCAVWFGCLTLPFTEHRTDDPGRSEILFRHQDDNRLIKDIVLEERVEPIKPLAPIPARRPVSVLPSNRDPRGQNGRDYWRNYCD